MNIKITATSITFKITEDELHTLHTGQSLSKTVPITGHDFTMAIHPDNIANGTENHDEPLALIFDKDKTALTLNITANHVAALMNMGRSKDGLYAPIDGLDIYLQVDLRADSRPRLKTASSTANTG